MPIKEKRAVYASYGIAHWNKGEYEVDHLIALSLGGSNSQKNLWPQSYLTEPWNAHTKDKLLRLVREGKVDQQTVRYAEVYRGGRMPCGTGESPSGEPSTSFL